MKNFFFLENYFFCFLPAAAARLFNIILIFSISREKSVVFTILLILAKIIIFLYENHKFIKHLTIKLVVPLQDCGQVWITFLEIFFC